MHHPLSVKTFIPFLLILMLFGSALPAPAQMATDRNKVTDADIARAVIMEIEDEPGVSARRIDVTSNEGVITLSGTVRNIAAAGLAARLAESVSGVKSVINELEVGQGKQYPDNEIRDEVRQRLAWSELVDHPRINVGVVDGEVTLTGEVESAAEKRRAQQDAWVPGVDRVDVEGLEVTPWAQDNIATDDSFEERSDPEIEAAINQAFEYNPRVVAREIDVRVTDGKVTLFGTVDSLPAKQEAEEVARNTSGVWRVRNYIEVSP